MRPAPAGVLQVPAACPLTGVADAISAALTISGLVCKSGNSSINLAIIPDAVGLAKLVPELKSADSSFVPGATTVGFLVCNVVGWPKFEY